MKELITFLNTNSGSLAILFSGIVTFSTVMYSVLTWRLVSETKKMRRAQTNPLISLSFQISEYGVGLVDLIFKNEGLGPAKDVKFKIISKESECYKPILDHLCNLGPIKSGIPYMAQGQVIKSFLTSTYDNYEEKIRSVIQFEITYKSVGGIRNREDITLHFPSLEGITRLGSPPILEISKKIGEMQKDFNDLVSGRKKVKNISYTIQDIENEREEQIRRIEDQIKKTKSQN